MGEPTSGLGRSGVADTPDIMPEMEQESQQPGNRHKRLPVRKHLTDGPPPPGPAVCAAEAREAKRFRRGHSGSRTGDGEVDMADREQLHNLRQQAHEAGIPGNSKMTEGQLKDALKKVGKGMEPQMAKQQAKR